MYTLLNILKLGLGSILVDDTNIEMKDNLNKILRLDFMSNFVFRLFENLSVQEDDPGRFKLEIMVNRGAALNRGMILNVQDHTISIQQKNFVDINRKLNMNNMDSFFKGLLNLAPTVANSPSRVPKNEEKKPTEATQEAT